MNPHTDVDTFDDPVDLPDDSELANPAAAVINNGPIGTLNRTKYLFQRIRGALATSWGAHAALGSASIQAAWSTRLGVWWATGSGDPDAIYSSDDYGQTWTALSVGLSGLATNSLDFDASGNAIVAANASTELYKFAPSGVSWSSVGVGTLIGTVSKPEVRCEQASGLWVVFYNDTAYGLRAATSSNRTTWTDRSAALPGAFASVGTFPTRVGVGGGRIVVATRLAGVVVQLASAQVSSPGTWTGTTITASVITTFQGVSHPVFSAEDGCWLLAIYGTTGGVGVTEIWRSTSGTAWTLAKAISASGVKVVQLAVVGRVWVGLTTDGYAIYSLDRGSTWLSVGMKVTTPSASNIALWSGGGGFLTLDFGGSAPHARSSIRIGNEGTPSLV